jgi:hypothetical protein
MVGRGERRVDRISRRYGLFGRVKGEAKTLQQLKLENESPREMGMDVAAAAKGSKAAQDVANALSAYLLIKVSSSDTFSLLLHRVDHAAAYPGPSSCPPGASLALSPAFSRIFVEPTRKFVWHRVLRRPVVATRNGTGLPGKGNSPVNRVAKQAGVTRSD